MEASSKNEKRPQESPLSEEKEKTVRGSGFTYTEKKERTDKSIPISEVNDEEIVQLPDLGKKNRP